MTNTRKTSAYVSARPLRRVLTATRQPDEWPDRPDAIKQREARANKRYENKLARSKSARWAAK